MIAQRKQEASTELVREFASDVLAGLGGEKKFLPFKYFYDKAGSMLFEQICLQPEYYLTRTEAAILEEDSPAIAKMAQSNQGLSIIELGSGNSTKTRILLRQMAAEKVCYFPIDISRSILEETSANLTSEFCGITVASIPHDYSDGLEQVNRIISSSNVSQEKLVLFLGSSIGNFELDGAKSFLRMLRGNMEADDLLLIGFDLHKDRSILNAAYNDKKGANAQFNLNLLERINNELQGEFDLDNFAHMAFYNELLHRMEMHLVSIVNQDVYVGALGRSFRFKRGETIHTENSYKYDLSQIRDVAKAGGFMLKNCFMDKRKWFCLALLSPLPRYIGK